jgi:hypothetical protein
LNPKIAASTRHFKYIPGRKIIIKFVIYYLFAILIEKTSKSDEKYFLKLIKEGLNLTSIPELMEIESKNPKRSLIFI